MAATTRTKIAASRKSRGPTVTDRQRANALLRIGNGGEEIVPNSEIDRILHTVASNHVVLVRRTREGYPVYRVTPAGQRWVVAQLASSPVHMGRFASFVRKSDQPVIEEQPNGEWRAIDYFRRVRTPWLAAGSRTPIIERAAKAAVRRTDPKKPIARRHTREDDWCVVHTL